MTDRDAWTVVRVAPERLGGWLERFVGRHGPLRVQVDGGLRLDCENGAAAQLPELWGPLATEGDPLANYLSDVEAQRRVGALIVHKGAHAVGIFDGPRLLAGRVGRHYVQGRTKAGGWSQQRYARRRGHQADRAYAEAAADSAGLLLGSGVSHLVCGGDRAGIAAVLGRPELRELADLPGRERGILAAPDPRRRTLEEFGAALRAVPISLNQIARGSAPQRDHGSGDER